MREILGRLGDVGYWLGCLGVVVAFFDNFDEPISMHDVGGFLIGTAFSWTIGWGFRYILSGYRGVKLLRPETAEQPSDV